MAERRPPRMNEPDARNKPPDQPPSAPPPGFRPPFEVGMPGSTPHSAAEVQEQSDRLDQELARMQQLWESAARVRRHLLEGKQLFAEIADLEQRKADLQTAVEGLAETLMRNKAQYEAQVKDLDADMARRREAASEELRGLQGQLEEARQTMGELAQRRREGR